LRTVLAIYLQKTRDFIEDLLTAEEWVDHRVEDMVRVVAHAVVGLYKAHGHIFRAGLAFSATDELAREAHVDHQRMLGELVTKALFAHPDVTSSAIESRQVYLALEATQAVLDSRLQFSSDWQNGDPDWDQATKDIEELFGRISGVGLGF
jgi:hypothetical protein